LPSLRALPLNAITFMPFILLPCESMNKLNYFGRKGKEYPLNRRPLRRHIFFCPTGILMIEFPAEFLYIHKQFKGGERGKHSPRDIS